MRFTFMKHIGEKNFEMLSADSEQQQKKGKLRHFISHFNFPS
jgi:hypothetical protein